MTRSERALALAALVIAVGFGALRLHTWTAAGTAPWARSLGAPLPLAFLGVLAALLVARWVLRASRAALALASIGWCLCVNVTSELPEFPSADSAGDTGRGAWLYLALALGGGLFALAPRRFGSEGERAAALLGLWSTGGLKLVQREDDAPFALFALACVLAATLFGRGLAPRALLRGPACAAASIAAALLVWWALAAAAGDSLGIGLEMLARLVCGALFAYALAGALDARGVRRTAAALLVGHAVALVLVALAVVEMRAFNDLERIVGWRLRLFGTHANQVAPMFAMGACLALPALLRRRAEGEALVLPRWLVAAVALGSLVCLVWTRSRTGLGALVVGSGVALCASAGALPRRRVALALAGIALALAAALALVVFVAPAGEPLRAALDARAQTQSSLGQRWHLWKMAAASLRAHPWLGLGPGQYYAHARFAEPSFYDGTTQSLHPHDLPLAAGESAGLPGMALLVALALAVLELGRARVLAARDGPERRALAGLLGALACLLAANIFDLGQSQTTTVPLFTWIALGLFAARGAAAPAPPTPLGARGAGLALALLVALAALPLAGEALVDLGQREASAGRSARAAALLDAALALQPLDARASRAAASAHAALGERERVLALRRGDCSATPGLARAWYQLGIELLLQQQPGPALESLARADELDPRGPHVGEIAFARAWAALQLGRPDDARAALVDGLRVPLAQWDKLPALVLEPRALDPPAARRVGFAVAGGGVVALGDALEQLGREALGLAREDEVRAQRLLGNAVIAHRAQGLWREPLELVRAWRERTPVLLGSLQVLEVELLCDAGDLAGARAAYRTSEYSGDPHLAAALLRGILASEDPRACPELFELPLELPGGKAKDIFFLAGRNAALLDLAAERALLAGELEAAFRFHAMALYDRGRVQPRIAASQRFFERVAALELGDEALLRALGVLVGELGRRPLGARDDVLLRGFARALAARFRGPQRELLAAAEHALRSSGPAAAPFLAVLERLVRPRRGS